MILIRNTTDIYPGNILIPTASRAMVAGILAFVEDLDSVTQSV